MLKSYIEQLQAQLNEQKKQYKEALNMDVPFHIAKKIRVNMIDLEKALLIADRKMINAE